MPYCPNCNQEQAGQFCAECGAQLQPDRPADALIREQRGDTGLDRSVRQTVLVSPSPPAGEEALPWGFCPSDGLYVRRDQTFRCRACGREHLCREHLDPEMWVCTECASELRGSARQELEARLAALRAEAGACLNEGDLAGALLACGQALALDAEDDETVRLLEAGRAALRDREAERARWQQCAKKAQARAARLEADLQQVQEAGEATARDKGALASQLARVQAEGARWQEAATKAQARLDEIAARERAATEARRRPRW